MQTDKTKNWVGLKIKINLTSYINFLLQLEIVHAFIVVNI